MLELGITFDYAKLLMDNEMAKMVKKIVGGINVNEETMAVDIIQSVGAAGEYVSHDHTFRHFKQEQSHSRLIDRSMRQNWLDNGSKDYTVRAYEEAQRIYKTHKPDPLPQGVESTLRDIIAGAEEEYGIKR